MFKLKRSFSLLLLLLFTCLSTASAQELKDWPRTVKVKSGSVTIYQPQLESLDGDMLKGRAAIAYKAAGSDEPVFGAAWFKSQVEIDRDERVVYYLTMEVSDTRFPEGKEGLGIEFANAVSESMKTWNLTSSLDQLTTSLAAATHEQKAADNLKVDPPKIIYRDVPAILVNIDGKAVLKEIENSPYKSVINTPYPLIYDNKTKKYHLNAAGGVWYQAENVGGPWDYNPKPPANLVQMMTSKESENGFDPDKSADTITAANAPQIVVAYKPTELISSEGEAEFKPLVDDLLIMSNTDSNVFMDVPSQNYFLIISGRWYQSKSMTGQWQYVKADQLPASFTSIPTDSQYADIRAYVAGTDEAHEAVMDAQIPQTASVKRGPADVDASYDGQPNFKEIDGTELEYAVNTSDSVIKAKADSKTKYYMVKDAVWYISDSSDGPWIVSDHAPKGIDQVPPSSPVYNTKYVYVYDATPEVVYVGYTPGYVGSYVYGPTIVYGTGWYYRPYITPYYYYPRQATWGFQVTYNPWTGWGFGLSWNYGPFRFGFHSGGYYHGHRHYRGRWGAGGYRPGYGSFNNNRINIDNSTNINIGGNRIARNNNNLYRNKNQKAKIRNTHDSRPITANDRAVINDRRAAQTGRVAAAGAAGGLAAKPGHGKVSQNDLNNKVATGDKAAPKNNVFSDRDGNIYRKEGNNWQARNDGKWNQVDRPGKADAATRPAVNPTRPQVKPAARPTVRPAVKPPQKPVSRPATQPVSRPGDYQSKPSTRNNSGYNRPTSVGRQQHSRQRSNTRSHSANMPPRGGARRR